jgi:hypothetical protein
LDTDAGSARWGPKTQRPTRLRLRTVTAPELDGPSSGAVTAVPRPTSYAQPEAITPGDCQSGAQQNSPSWSRVSLPRQPWPGLKTRPGGPGLPPAGSSTGRPGRGVQVRRANRCGPSLAGPRTQVSPSSQPHSGHPSPTLCPKIAQVPLPRSGHRESHTKLHFSGQMNRINAHYLRCCCSDSASNFASTQSLATLVHALHRCII